MQLKKTRKIERIQAKSTIFATTEKQTKIKHWIFNIVKNRKCSVFNKKRVFVSA